MLCTFVTIYFRIVFSLKTFHQTCTNRIACTYYIYYYYTERLVARIARENTHTHTPHRTWHIFDAARRINTSCCLFHFGYYLRFVARTLCVCGVFVHEGHIYIFIGHRYNIYHRERFDGSLLCLCIKTLYTISKTSRTAHHIYIQFTTHIKARSYVCTCTTKRHLIYAGRSI